jgi:hypothetical protein
MILEELISKSPKASKECHMSFDNRMIAENFNKSALNQTNIGVRLLLGLPGVSSVFSDGNADCLWFISTSTFGLFTFVGAAIFVYIYKPVR